MTIANIIWLQRSSERLNGCFPKPKRKEDMSRKVSLKECSLKQERKIPKKIFTDFKDIPLLQGRDLLFIIITLDVIT